LSKETPPFSAPGFESFVHGPGADDRAHSRNQQVSGPCVLKAASAMEPEPCLSWPELTRCW
jgi:hypothetical protein